MSTPSGPETSIGHGWWATSPLPGAIGILHLVGDVEAMLAGLRVEAPDVGRTTLAEVGGIDEAVVARLDVDACLVMPHGGPRIRQLLSRAVEDAGVSLRTPDPAHVERAWPEADSRAEAELLSALARTESPRAVPLLLEQLQRTPGTNGGSEPDPERVRAMRSLLTPPLIGIAGSPNVGKSTLLNALAGREVAIAADIAGTTRDAVVSRVILDGVACDAVDLPGRRASEDEIEQHAIKLSDRFITNADLLLLLVEHPEQPRPPLRREPDLVVLNKIDEVGRSDSFSGPQVSARTREGITQLAVAIRQRLVPDRHLESDEPWVLTDW